MTEGSQAQDQAGQSRAALKQRVQRGRPGKNAPRQREQAAVAPWGKPPKPMVLPPCAAPGNPPPGACGRSHPTSAGIDAAYCGSWRRVCMQRASSSCLTFPPHTPSTLSCRARAACPGGVRPLHTRTLDSPRPTPHLLGPGDTSRPGEVRTQGGHAAAARQVVGCAAGGDHPFNLTITTHGVLRASESPAEGGGGGFSPAQRVGNRSQGSGAPVPRPRPRLCPGPDTCRLWAPLRGRVIHHHPGYSRAPSPWGVPATRCPRCA